ncbi:acyl-CoA dehydrogenase family protein [Emcibacter nanhaiensis]|uniref:Acyl-CoA dehydrogenase n=1 Tax=Emcibacter nanhaiensis TaxID=1505037 RepID=A0A501PJP0_9PROT|nr:acyl-CoA dehydrogenase family protein [Emcibacter nanhaiensis]TPD60720.1 acyl-CoA dehydrogenase [Emcibacter nanhaiensis]
MNFTFSEEQNLIRETARGFLEEISPSTAVRQWMESDKGYDDGIWQQLAEDMGWAALAIPEDYDGLGLGYVELAIIMEECGYRLTGSPLFATICQAAQALIHGGTEAQKQAHLPAIAAGQTTATLAFGNGGSFGLDDITLSYREEGDGFMLNGTAGQVIDGASADLIITVARKEGSADESGVRLFVLPRETTGLSATTLKTMDQTRRLTRLEFANVTVGSDTSLEGGWDCFLKTCRIASIMLAAEQLGVSRWCLDAAVTYAMDRMQFGRAIGSFQAIKHKCADMMVRVESGISGLYYAACVIDADTDELAEASPIAKATLCSDAMKNAAECLQIHGGIGITWEADVHLYFKRARAGESQLGAPAWHREQMALAMDL